MPFYKVPSALNRPKTAAVNNNNHTVDKSSEILPQSQSQTKNVYVKTSPRDRNNKSKSTCDIVGQLQKTKGVYEGDQCFAELTEADRDSELLRRRDLLLQEIICKNQENESGLARENITDMANNYLVDYRCHRLSNGDVHHTGLASDSKRNRHRTHDVIEQELMELQKREDELTARHQNNNDLASLMSSNSSIASDDDSSKYISPSDHDVDNNLLSSDVSSSEGGPRAGAGINTEAQAEAHDLTTRYAHPGESRIVRELMEQRERELELRGRWKEMGLDVPEENSQNETPFTLPEPIPFQIKEQTTRPNMQVKDAETISSAAAATAETQTTKVKPFYDPEEILSDQKVVYIPENETPIEREIRMLGERECALRLARGLSPLVDNSTVEKQTETDVNTEQLSANDMNHHRMTKCLSSTDPTLKVNMKKLASNRLQLEIQKEKDRELVLKSQGSIHTTSEERKGEPVKYVEIISQQNPVARMEITPSVTGGGRNTVAAAEEKHVALTAAATHASVDAIRSTAIDAHMQPIAAAAVNNNSPVNGKLKSSIDAVAVNELESVFDGRLQKQQQQQQQLLLMKPKSSVKPTAAEKKILNELQEMHFREEELRNQRGLSTSIYSRSESIERNHSIHNN